MNATIKQDGSTRFAIRGLLMLDARALQAAGKGLASGLETISGIAQQKFLSGPRPSVLDVVTTRLRGSIETKVEPKGEGLVGRIGSNVPHATTHEFGLVGRAPIAVREHERSRENQLGQGLVRLRQTNQGKFLSDLYHLGPGGSITGRKRTLKQVARKQNRLEEIETGRVRAHERKNFKYQGRPFLRPAIEQGRPLMLEEIKRQLATLKPA